MQPSTETLAVIGQGYVGLPLAVGAAANGYRVVGLDIDSALVESLNLSLSPVRDVSNEDLSAVIASGQYRASTSFRELKNVDIIAICLPTPYENDAPNLSLVEAGAKAVGAHMSAGALVILESTTYPGTTEEFLLPILEQSSGLRAGVGFDLAFSPERIDPGNTTYKLHNTPRIVGGMTPRAVERAVVFYGRLTTQVVPVSNTATAEMVKLLENTFRHINIALVNEFAMVCHDMEIDVWEVINAASSKPFGFMPFFPGPGVGGHCIPVDPMYLSWRIRQLGGSARFIELARDINNAMPLYCVARIQKLLNERSKPLKGARVVICGVAYKANVGDVRESPSIPLIRALIDEGAIVRYHDPHVPVVQIPKHGDLNSLEFDDLAAENADCIVIVTPHSGIDYEQIIQSGTLIFDVRNALATSAVNVVKL